MIDRLLRKNKTWISISSDGEILIMARKNKAGAIMDSRTPVPSVRMGYSRIYINGGYFSAHRLVAEAWLKDYSEDLQVDHIDGDRQNNRPLNFRMVTNSQNQMGKVDYPRGSCKYRGVSLYKPSGKYVARICKDKKIMHIGYFDNAEAAAEAYNERAVELGFFPEALNNLPAQ